MVASDAKGQTSKMGPDEDGQANCSANDAGRLAAAQGSGGTGGGIGGRLPGDGGATVGKEFSQWVFKCLDYQLAYHSSSVEWYEGEIERAQAEIEKYREAIAWHQRYLAEARADLEELSMPDVEE